MDPRSSPRTALDRLTDPRSIAVVGASADPGKRGYQAVRALRDSGYAYPVYPVNPRGGELLGLPVLTDIAQLPPDVDLAFVALPGPAVPSAVRSLAEAGVAAAVVVAHRFRESGPAGAALEEELAEVVARTGIRVIGPNTSGMLNAATGANLVGVADVPRGPVSVVTQSGNMLLSLLADNRVLGGPGFHLYLGLGNQADLGYHECVAHLAGLKETTAIALHSEGLRDGREFLVAAAEATAHCPVVMLRGGRSEVGKRAALSHTGSVAGSDAVAAAVLRQAGVELVERTDELAVLAGVLATTAPMAAGTGVVVLADGGGHGTLAADALSAAGVPLAELSPETHRTLRDLLGETAVVDNPVDVAGATDTDPTLFAAAADALMADDGVGLVLLVGLFGGYHLRFDPRLAAPEDATAHELHELSDWHRVPLLVQSCYAGDGPSSHRILRDAGVTVLASIDHAVRAVKALHRRGARLATAGQRSPLSLSVSARGDRQPGLLDEPAARELVERAGLELGPWRFATSPAQVGAAIAEFGRPCAVKVVAPSVVHKSDVGGVRLNVTLHAASSAWTEIHDSVRRRVPDATVHGLVVAPMAEPGVELLIGAHQDPIFGPVVTFGTGGFLVEAMRDVSFRAAPLTALEAREMIEETRASAQLDGYRGLPPVTRERLAEFLVRVGDVVAANPGIAELDLNPVIARGDRLTPVDVRVVWGG